jgi:quercetin dioxygenase-like cupin family protein
MITPKMAALGVATALVCAWASAADAGAGGETATPVQRQRLPDMPGKQLTMVVIAYAPGQASAAHMHPGSVFAYVLEGEVTNQLEGQPAVTYKAGESWYEPPRAPHLVSRNASDAKPARLLAILVTDEGAPLKEPLGK